MTNDLTKPDNRTIAVDRERLWLVNTRTGHIMQWSPILAVKPGLVDCDARGNPINPADVPANHPFLVEQTKGAADRMKRAGAIPDTLQEFGRSLSDQAAKKFRSIEYDKAVKRNRVEYYDDRDCELVARRLSNIERRAEDALYEIHCMALDACAKLGISRSMYYEASKRV